MEILTICALMLASVGAASEVVVEAVTIAPPAHAGDRLPGVSKWADALEDRATPRAEKARIEARLVTLSLDPDTHPLLREEAQAVLLAQGGVTSVALLGEALAHEATNANAAALLAKHPRPEAGRVLADSLAKLDIPLQRAVIGALAQRDSRNAAPVLVALLHAQDAYHAALLEALGHLGGWTAAHTLMQYLDAPEPHVRQVAAQALEKCAAGFEADNLSHRAARCYEALAAYRGNEETLVLAALPESDWITLFDGESLEGWEGGGDWFRIEDNALVGGSLEKAIPHNVFLCTDGEYSDFELRLEVKLLGEEANAGVQIRSARIPGHYEVKGYQADLGQTYWGALYDESRRNKILAQPDADLREEIVKLGDWNTYVIRAEGPRIQLWLNGVKTVDYTEASEEIPQRGIIGLQIHSGPPAEAWYRNIVLRPINYIRH